MLTYERLLEQFWSWHDGCARPWSTQYKSAVFFHDDEQHRAARDVMARVEKGERKVRTELAPFDRFWLAEDYHQKYRLRQNKALESELLAHYPRLRDFVDSTAVTRVNAWLAGAGDRADLEASAGKLGLSDEARDALLAVCKGRLRK